MARFTYWMGRGDARKLASNYGGELEFGGLRDTDQSFRKKFKHMWELTSRADRYSRQNHDEMEAEVERYLDALPFFVSSSDKTPSGTRTADRRQIDNDREHLSTYRVLPTNQSTVIFSDIHLTNRFNRQNFFEWANKDAYLRALSEYYGPRNFALIENGDIEELLIYEPNTGESPDLEPDTPVMPDYRERKTSWEEIIEDRALRKRAQFEEIVADHPDYYETIADNFIARNAYYRTIGNHDYDMARGDYVRHIRDTLGISFPTASDAVLMTNGEAVDYFICHGHQFDTSCTPRFAPRTGESYSQGGAWAYQGPDRYWSLDRDGANYINPWLNGSKPFLNHLVGASPEETGRTGAAISKFLGDGGVITFLLLFAVGGFRLLVPGLAAHVITRNDLKKTGTWEALYEKNIAWEYFDNTNPLKAFEDEVEEGIRWYKFRHMDEFRIVDKLDSFFGSGTTKLVLGHSHEPRINSARSFGLGENAPPSTGNYINSAAAGRFENLIWGIEIIEGQASVISWHLNDEEALVRSVWETRDIRLPGTQLTTRVLVVASNQIISPPPGNSDGTSDGAITAASGMMMFP